MNNEHVAHAEVNIQAPIGEVWDALTNPKKISRYMFGAKVQSDWKTGSAITWKGEWKGKPYEDKGVILRIRPQQILQYSHYSPLSGKSDHPDNYHFVTITLMYTRNGTEVHLTQDNNDSEETMRHSEENWKKMLQGLKAMLESQGATG